MTCIIGLAEENKVTKKGQITKYGTVICKSDGSILISSFTFEGEYKRHQGSPAIDAMRWAISRLQASIDEENHC